MLNEPKDGKDKKTVSYGSSFIKDKSVSKNLLTEGKQSERELIIIKEIRKKGAVTVKDISVLIKGVSEKTIQRELVSLVDKGVLKREGERRWSRYLIA